MTVPRQAYDEREARWRDLDRRAADLKPKLIGMTIKAAMAEIAKHPGLSARVFDEKRRAVTADYRPGRVALYVRDGIVAAPDGSETPDR